MVTSYEHEMCMFVNNIEEMEKHNQDEELFILVKKGSDQKNQTVKCLADLHDNIIIQTFRFVEDPFVIQSLSNYTPLHIEKDLPNATTCTAVSQINVKSSKDSADCCIVGIVQISDTKLVCADFDNKCIKVADVETNTITSRRQLAYHPCDITLLPESRVAVTLSDIMQIHLHTTDGDLDQCGSIAVDGECLGIHWTGNPLLVSYGDPEPTVQVKDLAGRVRKTIQMMHQELLCSNGPDTSHTVLKQLYLGDRLGQKHRHLYHCRGGGPVDIQRTGPEVSCRSYDR